MAATLINPLYPRPHVTASTSSVATGFMLTVASSSSATAFTTSNFDQTAQLVFLDIQSNNVVVTFDGSVPLNGTRGHILPAGTNYTWQLATALDAKFATQGATAAQVYASLFSP